KGTGEIFTLPAKTVCVAAGTSPNVTYEHEYAGTFQLDADGEYFQGFELGTEGPDGFSLNPVSPTDDLGVPQHGFFTSYRQGRRRISFYGDNHPTYAGNVVKAMASAKDGYLEVVRLFAKELSALDLDDGAAQETRDNARGLFFAQLDDAFHARVVAVNRLTHN